MVASMRLGSTPRQEPGSAGAPSSKIRRVGSSPGSILVLERMFRHSDRYASSSSLRCSAVNLRPSVSVQPAPTLTIEASARGRAWASAPKHASNISSLAFQAGANTADPWWTRLSAASDGIHTFCRRRCTHHAIAVGKRLVTSCATRFTWRLHDAKRLTRSDARADRTTDDGPHGGHASPFRRTDRSHRRSSEVFVVPVHWLRATIGRECGGRPRGGSERYRAGCAGCTVRELAGPCT